MGEEEKKAIEAIAILDKYKETLPDPNTHLFDVFCIVKNILGEISEITFRKHRYIHGDREVYIWVPQIF